jgi:hypothetical protein
MAWQLPSEPFYKTIEAIEEKRKEKEKEKTEAASSPSRIDDDSTKLQYIDSQGISSNNKNNLFHLSDNGYDANKYYIDRTSDPSYSSNRKEYYTNDVNNKNNNNKKPSKLYYNSAGNNNYYGPQNWNRNDWTNIIQRYF